MLKRGGARTTPSGWWLDSGVGGLTAALVVLMMVGWSLVRSSEACEVLRA